MEAPRLILGGVSSGVGKTTLACGILAALRRRGLTVQPFKIGPDYIDPSYHTLAAQRASRNLDAWLTPPATVRELFAHAMQSAPGAVAVIEGVMGLFDGVGGQDETGSTAEMAKLLAAPALLVVEGENTPNSIAATVLGFQRFDPETPLAGVLVTGLAGPDHRSAIAAAVERSAGLPVLGGLPRRSDLMVAERHLGLVPATEHPDLTGFVERAADAVEQGVDLDRLLDLARAAPALRPPAFGVFPEKPAGRVRIALALDEAFSFYYHDNLDLLTAWGAELAPFSPLRDPHLPPDIGGVYVGGGFPEVYAKALADNVSLMAELRARAEDGLPIYAECGGMMYLCEGIETMDEMAFPMVGIVPGLSEMHGQRLHIGYATVRTRRDSLLGAAGQEVRAHEFHWSQLALAPGEATAAYTVNEQPGRLEGFAWGNVLASYFHLHFAAYPALARNFVLAAEQHHQRRGRA